MKSFKQGLIAAVVLGTMFGSGCQTEPQREPTNAEQKAQARAMVQEVLNTWEWRTWNRLLAEDVVLELKMGSVGPEGAVGVTGTYNGRDEAKAALREIYGDLKKNVSIWGELADGLEVALLADLNVAEEGETPQELPLVVHMIFNESGKIEAMTLASIDLGPLKAALDEAEAEAEADE